MKRIYISGPMTGLKDLNKEAFAEAADRVLLMGGFPIIPHQNGLPPIADYKQHLLRGLETVLYSDAILLIEGWTDSTGACIEANAAYELGIPVFTYNQYCQLEVYIRTGELTEKNQPTIATTKIKQND